MCLRVGTTTINKKKTETMLTKPFLWSPSLGTGAKSETGLENAAQDGHMGEGGEYGAQRQGAVPEGFPVTLAQHSVLL